jgi:hypothetical protein
LIIGTELVRALEALADDQVRRVTFERDSLSSDLFNEIQIELGPLLDNEKLNALQKSLKMQYPLNKRFRESELPWLPDEFESRLGVQLARLDRVSSEAHQARTQAAYIAGVLRPFNSKYTFRWFRDRQDLNVEALKVRIENLERARIENLTMLLTWADQVADLFRELVVSDKTEKGSSLSRSTGQIAETSSRTYLQSWFAFIKRYSDEILYQVDVDLDQDAGPSRHRIQNDSRMNSAVDDKISQTYASRDVDKRLFEAAAEMRDLIAENKSLKSQDSVPQTKPGGSDEPWQIPDLSNMPAGFTIYAESPRGERSSCNFESLESSADGKRMWLKTLSYLWADQPGLVKFDADLKIEGLQMRFSLPRWSLDEADSNLDHFVGKVLMDTQRSV